MHNFETLFVDESYPLESCSNCLKGLSLISKKYQVLVRETAGTKDFFRFFETSPDSLWSLISSAEETRGLNIKEGLEKTQKEKTSKPKKKSFGLSVDRNMFD